MRRPITLVLGISLLSLAVAAPRARAEGSRDEEVAASQRALDGHVFQPSPVLSSPFSTTYIGSFAGYAAAYATGPKYDLRGNVIGERSYQLGGLSNNLHYQLRIKDWLAFRVAGTAIIYTGINGASALAVGATARYFLGTGITAGYTVAPSFRAAFVFDFGFQPAFDLTVAAGIRRAIQTGTFDSGEVFVMGRTLTYRPGLSVAWAPHPFVGLQGEIRYAYAQVEKSSAEEPSGSAVDMAVALDLDFGAISGVPVGLAGVYRLLKPTSSEVTRIQDAGGGLFYTGRPHLSTGLFVTAQWFHVRTDVSANATIVQLFVRYYW